MWTRRLQYVDEQSTSIFLALADTLLSGGIPAAAPAAAQRSDKKSKMKAKQNQSKKGGSNSSDELWKPPAQLYPLADIGLNITDEMFDGIYMGKQKHDGDRHLVLERAARSGVSKMMLTGGTLEESKKVLQAARADASACAGARRLFSTVGTHPTRCNEFDEYNGGGPDAYLEALVKVAEDGMVDGTVVAIGECGLDYDRLKFCGKEAQLRHFERQLSLAERTRLPLFLHCRAAADDLLPILTANRHRIVGGGAGPGVVHSFDGTLAEAEAFIGLGFCVGLNGCSLRTAESLEVVRQLPRGSIMLETDAPWCGIKPSHPGHAHVASRFPVRKKERFELGQMVKDRSEPCCMVQVLEVVAGVRQEDPAALAREVYDTTVSVFRLGEGGGAGTV